MSARREFRLRPEDPADFEASDAVHEQAFGRPGEAALVRAGLARSAALAQIVVVLELAQGGDRRRQLAGKRSVSRRGRTQ